MNQVQDIALYRPILQEIALRMVGSIEDAEDIVQDTLLKWLQIDQDKIRNTKAYLIRSVTNNCITHLNAIKMKKDEFLSNLNTDKLFDKYKCNELLSLDLEDELQSALIALNQKLAPLEKAVFVLREVFELEYEHLQEILGQKKDNLRQLLCRAKSSLDSEKIKFNIEWPKQIKFSDSFKSAVSLGNISNLINELRKDIK